MPVIKIKLQVLEPSSVLEKRLKTVIADKINLAAQSCVKNVKSRIIHIIDDSIQNSFEVKSLRGGDLQAELGIPLTQIDNTIAFIIKKLSENIQIEIKPFSPLIGNVMRGSLTLKVFPKTLIDDFIHYVDANFTTKKGVVLSWMEWLLLLGDKIIVRDYVIDFNNIKGSRTGLATMKSSKKGGWRVPPQFSGTKNNNFITRALDDVADLMLYYLKLEFTRQL